MFIANLVRSFAEWRRYRTAIRELSGLDERMLNDIGLNRGAIRQAARFGLDR
jgi:uncharacterized protein YjiS (DUF1127 family)